MNAIESSCLHEGRVHHSLQIAMRMKSFLLRNFAGVAFKPPSALSAGIMTECGVQLLHLRDLAKPKYSSDWSPAVPGTPLPSFSPNNTALSKQALQIRWA